MRIALSILGSHLGEGPGAGTAHGLKGLLEILRRNLKGGQVEMFGFL
jgi:hypothetical protein